MYALIPAAGRGVRFGATDNKVFASLRGRPLLGWTLAAFARCPAVDTIVLVGNPADLDRLRELGKTWGQGKVVTIVEGGSDRQGSVRRGLAACAEADYVVIHDAARPCVTPEQISEAIAHARTHGATTAVIPVSDTLVRGTVEPDTLTLTGNDVPRDGLFAVQTPQAFARKIITDAHEVAARDNIAATDDAGLVRGLQGRCHAFIASPENIKVTRPADLALADAILAARTPTPPPSPAFRIGQGYDVHAFADGRRVVLGGVTFPDTGRGLLGHSDADVVLHALCDALLGATGGGDIGKLFPPSDMAHKDRASVEFLREVATRLKAAGWQVGNVDITILAEAPKIGPHAPAMQGVIAGELGIDPGAVGIKATTGEGLGFIGRGEGIAAHAVALVYRA